MILFRYTKTYLIWYHTIPVQHALTVGLHSHVQAAPSNSPLSSPTQIRIHAASEYLDHKSAPGPKTKAAPPEAQLPARSIQSNNPDRTARTAELRGGNDLGNATIVDQVVGDQFAEIGDVTYRYATDLQQAT